MSTPSYLHADSGLTAFFARYLMQKAISVFEWTIPENWDKSYFLYTLYGYGYVAVVKTDKYGVICQHCGLNGRNIYYRPTEAVIANPLLRGIVRPRIGRECTVIKLMPDYGSIMDIISTYAALMAVTASTMGLNIINSKLSYVFAADNKAAAEAFKAMLDAVLSGEPGVVYDTKLRDKKTGEIRWDTFCQNVGANFIAPELMTMLQDIENRFATAVGLPNANTNKRERLIQDEVNANNTETYSCASLWLEQLQEGAEACNKMFYNGEPVLSVDWRFKPVDTYGNGGATDEG